MCETIYGFVYMVYNGIYMYINIFPVWNYMVYGRGVYASCDGDISVARLCLPEPVMMRGGILRRHGDGYPLRRLQALLPLGG